MQNLQGQIAVVTGASRGAGRGIAIALGEAGATVYVTGRSTGTKNPTGRPGTIEETAHLVNEAGGIGIPVACDHTQAAQVEHLFGRVQADHGRLDILVNNAWSGYENMENFGARFWEQPVSRWEAMFPGGARAHFLASRYGAPLMLPQGRGLIVNTTYWAQGAKIGSVLYDTAKATINHLAWSMAQELKEHGIAAVALSPGWMRTEVVLQEFGVTEATWQTVPKLAKTESTQYIGRAVRALALDPNLMAKTGGTYQVGALAAEYGFTDIDGRLIPPYSH